jgi:arylsulfatase A
MLRRIAVSSYANIRLFVVATFLNVVAAFSEGAVGAAPPNILLIYADDMGIGDLAAGNPDSKIPTPNLDQLAAEGIRFTDAHSSAAVCTLSRYSILTGEYHWRHLRQNADFPRPSAIDAKTLTLPELLRQAGYHTVCIGKWHLGWDWDKVQRSGAPISYGMKDALYSPHDFDWSRRIPGGPTAHGFDFYFGDDIPNRPPYTWFENDSLLVAPDVELAAHSSEPAEGDWETEQGPSAPGWDFGEVMPKITDKAIQWLSEQRGAKRPFFLYFAMPLPHAPILPDAESRGQSQAGGYGDYVVQGDRTVGKLLKALNDIGQRDNTIVIFTSDNGPAPYAYERVRKFGHRSTGPFRGLKGDLWEGGHRMPFILRWPGQVKPGRVSNALISQIDLMATLSAIAGQTLPTGAAQDSLDFSPLLHNEAAVSPRTTLVYNTQPNRFALRQNEWVYIDVASGSASPAPERYDELNGYAPNVKHAVLSNLRTDRGQRQNVIKKEPDRATAMQRQLYEIVGERLRSGSTQP